MMTLSRLRSAILWLPARWAVGALVGGAVIFGGVGDALAYRTAGDLAEFAGTERVRWEQPLIRYSVHGEPPFGIVLDDALRLMEDSFRVWTEPQCSQVVFDQAGVTLSPAAPEDGQNTVEWVHVGWGELGFQANAAAVTDVQYAKVDDQWRIVEVDLYINADAVDWTFSGTAHEGKQDLGTVLVHEAGHMLGLMHPCEPASEPVPEFPTCSEDSNFNVTMHPAYSVERMTLSEDDIDGVCFLYPGANCEVEGCPPGQACTEVGCRVMCDESVCDDGEVCIESACELPKEPECTTGECAPCESDDDCLDRFACVEGTCQPGEAVTGDPCAQHSDCSDSSCTSDGYCSYQCLSDENCPEGWECDPYGECVTDLAPFGAECSEANECIGQQCLADLTDDPVCTRTCGPGDPECPLGWYCEEVEEREVCVPPVTTKGCGCRVGGPTSPGPLLAFLTLPLLGAIRFRRRSALQVSRKP